jgi:hypothetical protein
MSASNLKRAFNGKIAENLVPAMSNFRWSLLVRFLAMIRITVNMRLSSKHNHVIKNGEHSKSTAQNYRQAHITV